MKNLQTYTTKPRTTGEQTESVVSPVKTKPGTSQLGGIAMLGLLAGGLSLLIGSDSEEDDSSTEEGEGQSDLFEIEHFELKPAFPEPTYPTPPGMTEYVKISNMTGYINIDFGKFAANIALTGDGFHFLGVKVTKPDDLLLLRFDDFKDMIEHRHWFFHKINQIIKDHTTYETIGSSWFGPCIREKVIVDGVMHRTIDADYFLYGYDGTYSEVNKQVAGKQTKLTSIPKALYDLLSPEMQKLLTIAAPSYPPSPEVAKSTPKLKDPTVDRITTDWVVLNFGKLDSSDTDVALGFTPLPGGYDRVDSNGKVRTAEEHKRMAKTWGVMNLPNPHLEHAEEIVAKTLAWINAHSKYSSPAYLSYSIGFDYRIHWSCNDDHGNLINKKFIHVLVPDNSTDVYIVENNIQSPTKEQFQSWCIQSNRAWEVAPEIYDQLPSAVRLKLRRKPLVT